MTALDRLEPARPHPRPWHWDGRRRLDLADRDPDAEVVGIDVAAKMVAQAKAKAADRSGPIRLVVADSASFEDEEGFDLIAMLNVPPFFDRVIALLRPGGLVGQRQLLRLADALVHPARAAGARLRAPGPRYRRRGQVGLGTYYLARRA